MKLPAIALRQGLSASGKYRPGPGKLRGTQAATKDRNPHRREESRLVIGHSRLLKMMGDMTPGFST
ncbi:hypothetical protein ASD85_04850 [Rhizobium sp. Root651]|nr:hypothetical protein ASD85_04850 [Rhizobium sp. Root651]